MHGASSHAFRLRSHYFLPKNIRRRSSETRRAYHCIRSVCYSFHFSSLLYRAHRPPWSETRSISTWALFSSFPRLLQSYSTSQGGRLVTERRMVTDMYVFDLKTLVWEKAAAPSDDSTPAQRYFHSADSCEYRYPRFIIAFNHSP